MSQLPAIEDFDKQQPIVRDALMALVDKIGPSILMTHSQGGAFGWPVADARPDKVKAIVAIEPNGPPGRGLEFIGAPDWFKEGKLALPYGITSVPLTYDAGAHRSGRAEVRQGGQARRPRPRHLLEAGRAGAAAHQSARCRSWC